MNLVSLFLCFLLFSKKVFANPACTVCTVAIAGSLTIARKLGVDDCIVALWSGALLTMLGYWTILFLEKKGWTFWGYKLFSMLISLSVIGAVYIKDLTYTPNVILGFLYIDYFLFTALIGTALVIFSVHFYAWMKAKNGGHAHFPFEKVVLPISLLLIASVIMNFYPICDCHNDVPESIVSMDDLPSFD